MEKAAPVPILAPPPIGAAALTVDLADLVQSLVSLKAPSRELDHVVEAMLGGDAVKARIGTASVLDARWLAGETPAYTAGGPASSVLARRRGYRLSVTEETGALIAEARDLRTGALARATATLEGAAAAAAIASLAAMEMLK